MPAPQEHVSEATPLGARLVADGATFRVWPPGPDKSTWRSALRGARRDGPLYPRIKVASVTVRGAGALDFQDW